MEYISRQGLSNLIMTSFRWGGIVFRTPCYSFACYFLLLRTRHMLYSSAKKSQGILKFNHGYNKN